MPSYRKYCVGSRIEPSCESIVHSVGQMRGTMMCMDQQLGRTDKAIRNVARNVIQQGKAVKRLNQKLGVVEMSCCAASALQRKTVPRPPPLFTDASVGVSETASSSPSPSTPHTPLSIMSLTSTLSHCLMGRPSSVDLMLTPQAGSSEQVGKGMKPCGGGCSNASSNVRAKPGKWVPYAKVGGTLRYMWVPMMLPCMQSFVRPCMRPCMQPCMQSCMQPCMQRCTQRCMQPCMNPCMQRSSSSQMCAMERGGGVCHSDGGGGVCESGSSACSAAATAGSDGAGRSGGAGGAGGAGGSGEGYGAHGRSPLQASGYVPDFPAPPQPYASPKNREALLSSLGRHLLAAAQEGREALVARLLDAGANPDFCAAGGWTPLHRACAKAHKMVVNVLLIKKACPNSPTVLGFTPLHVACINDFSGECVNLLIDAGADLECWNRCGQAPLHLAAACGNAAASRALVSAGASTIAKDDAGHVPNDVAATVCVKEILTPNKKYPRYCSCKRKCCPCRMGCRFNRLCKTNYSMEHD